MNERYQKHALEQLRTLSKQDKPFFLNYWPLFPATMLKDGMGYNPGIYKP
jgi:arylsulfatase